MIDRPIPTPVDLYAAMVACRSEQKVQADRIEDKLDQRLTAIDDKVAGLSSRLDRIEGSIGMLRWLGPTGIAALVFGLAKSAGFI